MINIFFTSFKEPLEQDLMSEYLSLLSPELRERNSRFLRWQNRHEHLLGKLLLIEALRMYGVERNIWDYIRYNSYQRPYLTLPGYDFNVSHSGDFVVCAIGKNIRLGIDIEENRKVNFKNFHSLMTPGQWDEINRANNPLKEFYRYWTIKESVIKADGRGFAISLDELEVKNNSVQYEDEQWLVTELEFANGYSGALATDEWSEYKMHEIDFYRSSPASRVRSKLVST
ncbi:4'-phosphopantetheinyl transferase family protein [Fulvivirga imtechensis]|nr:4'-phosphopantetheinyl transferase superfamily protein [Fulvivirga imtechensis]